VVKCPYSYPRPILGLYAFMIRDLLVFLHNYVGAELSSQLLCTTKEHDKETAKPAIELHQFPHTTPLRSLPQSYPVFSICDGQVPIGYVPDELIRKVRRLYRYAESLVEPTLSKS
jgi:hypothetical protein